MLFRYSQGFCESQQPWNSSQCPRKSSIEGNCFLVNSELLDCVFQDLANQIRYSEAYDKACRDAKVPMGTFLSLPAAEWFSGLPTNWTDLKGKVSPNTFKKMFPHACSKDSVESSD